jgi:hypothetical protein
MKWTKSLDGSFILSSQINKHHHINSLTKEILDDPERHFQLYGHPVWVPEVVKYDNIENADDLPSGCYHVNMKYDDLKSLTPYTPSHDKTLFSLNVVEQVLKDFNSFFSQRSIYESMGLSHKRGILLYGPPGTGKTTAINIITDSLINKDALILSFKDTPPEMLLDVLREDPRMKICIFEEVTQMLKSSSRIGEFLTFLDGQQSLTNAYIIATTNYPEKLPGNIIDRPGRFDLVFNVQYPNEEDRKVYMHHFLKRDITDKELKVTKNRSLAEIRHLILNMLTGQTIEQIEQEYQDKQERIKTGFKEQIDENDLDDYIL